MYKYKWHGENLDALEYISYEKNREGMKTGKVLVSSKFNVLKILDAVPAEYKKIEGYDWFTGEIP